MFFHISYQQLVDTLYFKTMFRVETLSILLYIILCCTTLFFLPFSLLKFLFFCCYDFLFPFQAYAFIFFSSPFLFLPLGWQKRVSFRLILPFQSGSSICISGLVVLVFVYSHPNIWNIQIKFHHITKCLDTSSS